MAEINKRNLVDETAAVYAANTLANNPTPLFSTGMPAKIIRASIANTNLLSKDGDLFVGTGGTYTETIDGTEYTYAKIAKKNQSELFVNGLNSTATNVGLAANVGKFIDDRLRISNSTATTEAISAGNGANAGGHSSVALGVNAVVSPAGTNSIQLGGGTNETAMSFQVGNHQMLDLNTGKIPLDRINQVNSTQTLVIGGTAGGTNNSEDTVYGIGAKASTKRLAMNGMAIGAGVEAVDSGDMAIGYKAYCKGGNNIAIGYQAKVGVADNTYHLTDCIAIGNEAIVSQKNQALNKSIQLGKGINLNGGLKVFDWQLLNFQGFIPLDRIPTLQFDKLPTLQYQHNLTLSAKVNGAQVFYLSFNIITDSATSFGANYSEQGALNFLTTLAKTLYDGGYITDGEFKRDCVGYDISNGAQMMWLSSDDSAIKYYYISGGIIQSRALDISSTRSVIYVDDKVIAGFKL